ncbi:MAG: hypothetical protein L3J54_05980 [Draconibacterium sp.]|nr:hypothetical protein [Draconibacterium sp.]
MKKQYLKKYFRPILKKYGVELVLTGHDYSYERGMATDNPDIKPSIDYVVPVSGSKPYGAGNKNWVKQKGGFSQLYRKIRIKNNVLDYGAFTADGELFNKFILKK